MKKDGIEIARQMVGNYVTSLRYLASPWLLMRADDELEFLRRSVNTVAPK